MESNQAPKFQSNKTLIKLKKKIKRSKVLFQEQIKNQEQ